MVYSCKGGERTRELDLVDAAQELIVDVYKINEVRELLGDCFLGTEAEIRERKNVIFSLFYDVVDVSLLHANKLKAILKRSAIPDS